MIMHGLNKAESFKTQFRESIVCNIAYRKIFVYAAYENVIVLTS